jgi:hypothetical protein
VAKFIVDRRRWYRGQRGDLSRLLTSHGTRCCIGFVAQQCGIEDSRILGRPTVEDAGPDSRWPIWMRVPAKVEAAYLANDSVNLTDGEREAALKAIFAEHGDEIEFIN